MITHKDYNAYKRKLYTMHDVQIDYNLSEPAARKRLEDASQLPDKWTKLDKERLTERLKAAQIEGQAKVLEYYNLKNMGHALSILRLPSTTALYYNHAVARVLKAIGLKLLRGRLYKQDNKQAGVLLSLDEQGALMANPVQWLKENVEMVKTIIGKGE